MNKAVLISAIEEASQILAAIPPEHAPHNMREPLVAELTGFARMLADGEKLEPASKEEPNDKFDAWYQSQPDNAVLNRPAVWQIARDAFDAGQLAQLEQPEKQEQGLQLKPAELTPEWLWSWLMDWCKRQGVSPASQNSLFRMVSDARERSSSGSSPTLTELQKDAPHLLLALQDAWPYVHQSCTIAPRKNNILALMRKHGEFADFHAAKPPEQDPLELLKSLGPKPWETSERAHAEMKLILDFEEAYTKLHATEDQMAPTRPRARG